MKNALSEDFFNDLIIMSVRSKKHFLIFEKHLKNKFIPSDKHRFIWNEIKSFYYANQRVHGFSSLIQALRNKNTNGNFEDSIEVLLNIKDKKIYSEQENNIINIFEDFIKQSIFVEAFNNIADLFNKENKEDAYNNFVESSQKLMEVNMFDENNVSPIFKGWEYRNVQRELEMTDPDRAFVIPSGFDWLDNSCYGGLHTKEIEGWLGDSGVGKSKLLTTRGVNSARRGFNVLHIQLEGSKEQCEANYDACWTGLEYRDIRFGKLSTSDIKTRTSLSRKMIKMKKGEIFVHAVETFDVNKRGINFEDIKEIKINVEDKFQLKINHIIIDYLELMSVSSGRKYDYKGGDIDRMIDLSREFKNFCVSLNILGTTVFQSHTVEQDRLKDPKFVLKRDNIGKSTRVIDAFSYFLTINQTPYEKLQKIVRIYEEKLREHPSGKIHKFKQNLGKSRFYDRKSTQIMKEEEEMFEDD